MQVINVSNSDRVILDKYGRTVKPDSIPTNKLAEAASDSAPDRERVWRKKF